MNIWCFHSLNLEIFPCVCVHAHMCVPAGVRGRSECVCLCIGVEVLWEGCGLICPICDTLTYCPGKGTPGPDQPALRA